MKPGDPGGVKAGELDLPDRLGPCRLLRKLGINGRKGLNFYGLRHTFETMAGESKDQVAVDAIILRASESQS